ncbi:type II toxin-antitoxin system RelE/ParE family toxin [Methylicorpusculum sp.]|uniref:type II toxin-antitoxin system RelE family toxin n=1 Tax=Methylicorpusculum sp. TaxID=2713644 RepID=UPI0027286360|nr:hypothetical protein [Methylicorpusculum sp.]MDO8846454.1 hypothetical protein [Methylicorpusculum sp.]
MKHYTSSDFWELYWKLPVEIRELADKNYELLKENPRHLSIRLKRIEELWSARVGQNYRVIGIDTPQMKSNGFGSVLMPTMKSLLPNMKKKVAG